MKTENWTGPVDTGSKEIIHVTNGLDSAEIYQIKGGLSLSYRG